MRRFILSFVSFAVVAALYTAVPLAQSGYDLFQQGLAKERGEGNLQQAIQLYERAIAQAGPDRARWPRRP